MSDHTTTHQMNGAEDGVFATYPSLRGAVAFVSGGASGLGAEFVTQLAAQGARVGFVDIQEEAGHELVKTVAARGWPKPLFHPCDVRDIAALREAIRRTGDELGPVTVLVNNAANDQRQPVAELTEQEWDAGMAVNVRHHFFAAQAVAPMMRRAGGGSIINVGSISAHIDLTDLPVYITAKAGIEGLTRTLARELGGRWDPGELCDPGVGDDRTPTRVVGNPRGRGTHRATPVPAAQALPGRHRQDGALAGCR